MFFTIFLHDELVVIKNKFDLKRYLDEDCKAMGRGKRSPSFFGDLIWRYQCVLRYAEYYKNTNSALSLYYKLIHYYLGAFLGFTIPCNVFGPGLSIAHIGTIVVNSNAVVGKNCRLHVCVNIGESPRIKNKAPVIDDDVYIGPGAKIYGDIYIAKGVMIGANAVVNRSCYDENVVLAGVPARVVSVVCRD